MPSALKPTQANIKKTIREILFKKSNHPTELLFQELNILNFDKLKLLKMKIFMWKVHNNEVTQTFSNEILFTKDQNFGTLYL